MIEVFIAIAFLLVAALIGRWIERRQWTTTITVTSALNIAAGDVLTIGGSHFRVRRVDQSTVTIGRA